MLLAAAADEFTDLPQDYSIARSMRRTPRQRRTHERFESASWMAGAGVVPGSGVVIRPSTSRPAFHGKNHAESITTSRSAAAGTAAAANSSAAAAMAHPCLPARPASARASRSRSPLMSGGPARTPRPQNGPFSRIKPRRTPPTPLPAGSRQSPFHAPTAPPPPPAAVLACDPGMVDCLREALLNDMGKVSALFRRLDEGGTGRVTRQEVCAHKAFKAAHDTSILHPRAASSLPPPTLACSHTHVPNLGPTQVSLRGCTVPQGSSDAHAAAAANQGAHPNTGAAPRCGQQKQLEWQAEQCKGSRRRHARLVAGGATRSGGGSHSGGGLDGAGDGCAIL